MYDPKSTEVFFKSCGTYVPFQNPSDAAIAHLYAAGFTESAIKTVLDFIVFNPVFDPKEVTLKSAWSIGEIISEHRRKQAEQRSAYDHRAAPQIGGPPIPVVRLVASRIFDGMPPFGAAYKSWELYDKAMEICEDLRGMSLVHRSWTDIAQDFLFRRLEVSNDMHRDKFRGLLQHPYLSRVREFICEVPCDKVQSADEEQDADNQQTDEKIPEAIDYSVHLLRRLGPLRHLSLVLPNKGHVGGESYKNHCSHIYSEVARHLPNLNEFWLAHQDVGSLHHCVESILRGRLDQSPITLNKLGVFIDCRGRRSGASFSPAVLRSSDQSKDLEVLEVIHDGQDSEPVPESSGTRDVFFDFTDRYPLGAFMSCLFDRDMHSAVFGDIFPGIRRLAISYPYAGKLDENADDYDEFRDFPADAPKIDTDTNAKWYFSRWMKKCTALKHIELVFSENYDLSMKTLPISDFPSSTEVVSIYLPENGREIVSGLTDDSKYMFLGRAMAAMNAGGLPRLGAEYALDGAVDIVREKRSCGLEHLTKQLLRRPGKSALKRFEVIFCRELDSIVPELGLEATIQDARDKIRQIDVPSFLKPISRKWRSKGVDFVVQEAILYTKH